MRPPQRIVSVSILLVGLNLLSDWVLLFCKKWMNYGVVCYNRGHLIVLKWSLAYLYLAKMFLV